LRSADTAALVSFFLEGVGTHEAGRLLFGDGWHADLEAAMKTVLLGLTGAVFCGVLVGVNPVKLGAEHMRFEHLNAARTPSPILETDPSQSQKAGEVHSAVVDLPKVADLSHASPDTWHTLPPPVEVYEQHPSNGPARYEAQPPDISSAATYLATLQLQ
jgi:hypothetical protein